MRYLLNGLEMKAWEKRMMETYRIPSILLMERAACSVVKELLNGSWDLHKVLVVCGSGNNGGDGIAIARMLKLKGIDVEVCLAGSKEHFSEETKIQMQMYEAFSGKMVALPNYSEYTVIVDAILGIGCSREITGNPKRMIENMNQSRAKVIAVDVPSGVSSNDGIICGVAVKADVTITFFAEKLGMMMYPGRNYCGKIIVEDLEVPFFRTEECKILTYGKEDLVRLPLRKNDGHKGSFGKVLVIAGSDVICGAAYLAAAGAYKTGAGLVKIYTPMENKLAMQVLLPEALLEIYDRKQIDFEQLTDAVQWADVIVIGPGIGTDDKAEQILNHVFKESDVPMVVDADGINLLAKNKQLLSTVSQKVILTPHILEMARLLGINKEELKHNSINHAQKFTEEFPITLILKDARTIVAERGELIYFNTCGNSGMATGGSGDVLAGITGALLAQGMKAIEAARMAVFLHGMAGDAAEKKKGSYGMVASDLLEAITEVTNI